MGTHHNSFQSTTPVLNRFGKSSQSSRGKYEQFLQDALDKSDGTPLLDHIRNSNAGKRNSAAPELWVIGDQDFQKTVLKKDQEKKCTIAAYKKLGLEFDDLLKKVCRVMEVSEELVIQKSKRTHQAKARMVLCYYAMLLGIPTREIGENLGIQQAAVSNASRKGKCIAAELNINIV